MEHGPRMEQFGRRLGKEIGSGSEKKVFQDADHPKEVIGVYHTDRPQKESSSEQYTRAQFYLHKILHLLYPENFPNILLGTTKPRAVAFDKVQLDKIHLLTQKISQEGQEIPWELIPESYLEQIDRLEEQLSQVGIIDSDMDFQNVTRSRTGQMQYIDVIEPWIGFPRKPRKNFDEEKLQEAIGKIKDPKKKAQALRYLDRLVDLHRQQFPPQK